MSYLKILYDAKASSLLDEWLNATTAIFDKNGNAINDYYCFTPRYKHYYDHAERILKTLPYFNYPVQDFVETAIVRLKEPEFVKTYVGLKNEITTLHRLFDLVQRHISNKLKLLKSYEFNRIDEALCCFHVQCYNATIGMAVSAIEYRLLALLKRNNICGRNLEDLTLGQMIKEYLEHKNDYNNCIPKKHEPLLNLSNTYRIFSVHPKKEMISLRIADTVLNLTFEFLLDKKTVV